MKQVTTWVLAICWALPLFGDVTSSEQQARKVQIGKKVEVTLAGGEFLMGRMGAISESGFVLWPKKIDRGTSRTLTFAEVAAVRPRKPAMGKTGWILTIVPAAAIVGLCVWLKATDQLH